MSLDLHHEATSATGRPEAVSAHPRVAIPVRATVVMTVLCMLAAAVNYASNLVFSRVLTPASYGDLNALFALTVIAAVPCSAAQTVIADRLATYAYTRQYGRVAYLIRHAAAHVAVYAGILGVVYLAAIPLVQDLLDLQGSSTALALAPMLVLSFFMPLAFGILQGLDRFVALGAVMLWVAVSRIAFGVPWAVSDAGGGPGGALLGTALGNIVALAVVAWLIRDHLHGRGSGAARAGIKRRLDARSAAAAAAFTGFAILSNADVLLAKALLDGQGSGEYAALATIGKIVFFLPAAVALFMVPNAARARFDSGSSIRVLRLSALLVAAATLLVAVLAALAPTLIIRLMFGDEYAGAASGVLPIGVAGAGLAIMNLLVVYTVAISDRRWLALLLVGTVGQAAAILAFHGSPTEVATAQAVVVWTILIINEALFHPLLRTRRWALRRVAA